MYKIFLDRNKQYILDNKYLTIDYVKGNPGDIIKFDKILLIKNEKKLIIGNPIIEGEILIFKIKEQIKQKKINIIKFKRRKNYIRKQGHRQKYTIIELINNKEI